MGESLINRLENADGADRELDAAIEEWHCADFLKACKKVEDPARELGWRWAHPEFGTIAPPARYTSSIDETIFVVGKMLPEWKWSVNRLDYGYTASVKPPLKTQGDLELQDLGEMAAHPTNPAIALMIALLKSVESDNGK